MEDREFTVTVTILTPHRMIADAVRTAIQESLDLKYKGPDRALDILVGHVQEPAIIMMDS